MDIETTVDVFEDIGADPEAWRAADWDMLYELGYANHDQCAIGRGIYTMNVVGVTQLVQLDTP